MKIRFVIIFIFIFLIVVVASLVDSLIHGEIDSPKKSDVIIVLGSGDSGRLEKASELYNNGYADFVIMTPIYSTTVERAAEIGIPEEAVIEEHEATSTYTNATESLKLMDENGFESALIVTSDYHLKRTKLIFDRVSDDEHNLRYIAAYNKYGEAWYESQNAHRVWFSEMYKMWGYRLGLYNFLDQPDENDL